MADGEAENVGVGVQVDVGLGDAGKSVCVSVGKGVWVDLIGGSISSEGILTGVFTAPSLQPASNRTNPSEGRISLFVMLISNCGRRDLPGYRNMLLLPG